MHNPASSYAREMAKWEMGYSPYGPPGRPREAIGFQSHPLVMYRMQRSATNGDFQVVHYTTAANEAEERNYRSRGYYGSQTEAIEAIQADEQARAVAAAERAFHEQHMSEKARAEAQAADDATSGHLAEVPVTPIRKRGRPAKAVATE